jgi:phospholipid transport system substrate-binding protein
MIKTAVVRPIALLVIVLAFSPQHAIAQDSALAERAKAFVEEMTQAVISELTDPGLSLDEQEARFENIVTDYVAYKSIARWVLGRAAWSHANDEQRERYLRLYADLMTVTYAHRFQDYAGETLSVDSARPLNQRLALVSSTMRRPGHDRPLKIEWMVRKTNDRFRVMEIKVEGYSMARAHKEQFASILKNDRTDISPLLTSLEKQVAEARLAREAELQQTAKNR